VIPACAGRRWLPLLLFSLACGGREPVGGPVVYAASSLTEVLETVAQAWGQLGNEPVSLTFDASSRLARQLEAGAPADVFISADEAWMEHIAAAGLVRVGTRRELATNSLVVVVAAGDSRRLADVGDLAQVSRVAVAGENVPAGRYARKALAVGGAWSRVAPHSVGADNVRVVLAWVADGEVDAGVVYATDARVEPRVRTAFELRLPDGERIQYPAAVLVAAPRADAASAFLAFCMGAAGQEAFRAAGFGPPGGARDAGRSLPAPVHGEPASPSPR
jgi:molybdate transport system substrate-binding protein